MGRRLRSRCGDLFDDAALRGPPHARRLGPLSERFRLDTEERERGWYREGNRIIAFARTPGYETCQGLGWYGCIESAIDPAWGDWWWVRGGVFASTRDAVRTSGMKSSTDVYLNQSFSPSARFLAGAGGTAIIAVVVTELWRGVWPPGWHSLFIGPIIIGGVAIGALLLAAAIVGEQISWTISDTGIAIHRRTILGMRQEIVPLHDLVSVDLREHEWDSRPSTFEIVLQRTSGNRLVSPDCASRAEAEALRDRLRTHLGKTR